MYFPTRSAHSGLSSSLRTSIARTSRAKISASRESSIRGILWKTQKLIKDGILLLKRG